MNTRAGRGDAGTRRRGDEKQPSLFRRVAASPRPRVLSLALALAVFVVLLYGVVYPNLRVVTDSLQVDGDWSLASYRELLSRRAVLEAVWSSVVLSLSTVALCAVV